MYFKYFAAWAGSKNESGTLSLSSTLSISQGNGALVQTQGNNQGRGLEAQLSF